MTIISPSNGPNIQCSQGTSVHMQSHYARESGSTNLPVMLIVDLSIAIVVQHSVPLTFPVSCSSVVQCVCMHMTTITSCVQNLTF